MASTDPHSDLHDIASVTSQPHQSVPVNEGDDWRAAVDALNKQLTKRINDLRTDTDTFETAVSKSVQALTADVHAAKTHIQNNADAIAAQDGLINEAKQAAAQAKTAADAAQTASQAAAAKIAQLEAVYAVHTHDLTATVHGATGGPKEGK